MDYRSLLEQAEHYVRTLYGSQASEKLLYHNLRHTEGVVEAATQIAQHYQLSDMDFFIVCVAAWFHDLGYLNGSGPAHEERGARMAQSFLEGTGVEFGVIESVK